MIIDREIASHVTEGTNIDAFEESIVIDAEGTVLDGQIRHQDLLDTRIIIYGDAAIQEFDRIEK